MTEVQDAVLARLMERHGRTFCDELGIDIARGTPSPLFRWLVASILFSARIGADLATKAARALSDAGWQTSGKMAQSTWEERVRVLNQSGYARYDESTARMLGEDVALVEERWKGDLRRLREAAGRDPEEERTLLKEFKGLGDVGADIFFREAQIVWDEHYPFVDGRGLETAQDLGLPGDATTLAKRVSKRDLPRLAAALARARLEGDLDAIRKGD
ncbi:hypothetical protein [Salinarimonas rosea]|uniref:hypothetical protein n=1 Tax=Salinarimonas rosea TaxID=552063 RepID=UPI0004048AF6|nr:hypothetical protein [Salinarimonas rosea]